MRVIGVLVLIIGILALTPLYAQPEAGMGMINGVVMTEDGQPSPNTAVVVQAGGKTYTWTTNAAGAFNGLVPVGLATLSAENATTTCTVKAGEISKVTLTVKWREVTQTVFNAAGQPVPLAEVSTSYCWRGEGRILTARADAQGVVKWTGLPPVRVITWGEGVAAAVIPETGALFSKPLPAPPVEKNMAVSFGLSNLGTTPARLSCRGWRNRNSGEWSIGDNYDGQGERLRRDVYWMGGQPAGTRVTFLATLHTSPLRLGIMRDIYLPYPDGAKGVHFTLPLQEAVTVRSRFTLADGTPVPGVNRLTLVPEPGQPTVADIRFIDGTMLEQVIEQPDGGFTATLVYPGRYRLLVDLFDESAPPLPALQLMLRPGVQQVTVTLPPPLAQVPAGAEVGYLTRTAPQTPRTLHAAALAPTMPVFGPQERLLALWYHPSTRELCLWNGLTPEVPAQRLVLRSVFLQPTDSKGQPYTSQLICYPLLPLFRPDDRCELAPADGGLATALVVPPTRRDPPGYRVDLWSGKYAHLEYTGGPVQDTLAIPADGKATLPWTLAPALGDPRTASRRVNVQLPPTPGNIPQAERYAVTYDVPTRFTGFDVPRDATRMTVHLLGVGVARDVALPPLDPAKSHDVPSVAVPPWDPAATVSGQVLQPDGTPLANRELLIGTVLEREDSRLTLRTDAQGRFTVRGVLPGPLFVYLPEHIPDEERRALLHLLEAADTQKQLPGISFAERQHLHAVQTLYQRLRQRQAGGWTLEVPPAGLTNVTLRLAESPVRLPLVPEIPYGAGWRARTTWWLPDAGTPRRLPGLRYEADCHDLAPASGWLWSITSEGRAFSVHLTPAPGWNVVSDAPAAAPLGLLFPFDPESGLPGEVTLIGEGPRAGVRVACPEIAWCPSPMLGAVVAQIDAVPPGPYRVVVATPRGPVEAPVTVTEHGGAVSLAFPPTEK